MGETKAIPKTVSGKGKKTVKKGAEQKVKIFVLDTNVLLHNPNALFSFANNIVVLPLAVIHELDGKKTLGDEVGRNARETIRLLKGLRSRGKLNEGVKNDFGGTIRVDLNNVKLVGKNADLLNMQKPDHRILAVACNLSIQEKEKKDKGKEVWLITKDISLTLLADVFDVLVDDYTKDKVNIDELYSGWREIVVPGGKIDEFRQEGILSIPGECTPHEFLHLVDKKNPKKTLIVRNDKVKGAFVGLDQRYNVSFGLTSVNMEQRMAFELLRNPDIDLVTLVGQAGTGKTLLALAAGLEDVIFNKIYGQIIVSRPIIPMGKDIGFLPGDKDEKLANWMQPIFDNMKFLLSRNGSFAKMSSSVGRTTITRIRRKEDVCGNDFGEKVENYFGDNRPVTLEAITYIRGRSIPGRLIIVDEAQNLTPHEIKTIVSRAGEGTKVVLTGDPYQIDNPYLDSASNGLTYAVEKLRHSTITGHVTLFKTERSRLASLATTCL